MSVYSSFYSLYPNSITPSDVKSIREDGGGQELGPVVIYDESRLQANAEKLGGLRTLLPSDIQFQPRYAVKANTHSWIINFLEAQGIGFDASSFYEVERLIKIGVSPEKIMLTAQQIGKNSSDNLAKDYRGFKGRYIYFNASSLHQLEEIGKMLNSVGFEDLSKNIAIRINPGEGSGIAGKTNVAGADSGFGIWYEYLPEVKNICRRYGLTVEKVHTHIGSGTEPLIWGKVARKSLALLDDFDEATWINLGGGFKVARNDKEVSTDLAGVGKQICEALKDFEQKTNRRINLELEPGTFLVADTAVLVAKVIDIVDTGEGGYKFLKLNCGMNDFMRPILYGAEHRMDLCTYTEAENNLSDEVTDQYVVIGHCCEGSDRLTMLEDESPDRLKAYKFTSLGGSIGGTISAKIGDEVVVQGVGAYGSSMSSHYNSFPFLAEFVKTNEGGIRQIRRRSHIDDLLKYEIN